MKKRIKLHKKRNGDYYKKDEWVLCEKELKRFFEVSDKPDKLDVVLSGKEMKNSYFIWAPQNNMSACHITLSSKKKIDVYLTGFARRFLKSNFPRGAYVAIEA